MNERIMELADKVTEDMPGPWVIPDEFCKKFAELIIKECIDLCELWNVTPGSRLAEEIKKQFGVE